VIVEL
jgi:hypothetical protein